MSIPAINWCIEQRDLPPAEWVLLFHLCHCHNHDTGRCDPSQEYLSEMANMGERTVRRHLRSLESKGRIARKKRGVHGGGRVSDLYALGFETAKMAGYVTGHLMSTNRPSRVENVHEMAGKHGRTGKEQEDPPVIPQAIEPLQDPDPPPDKPPVKARLPVEWTPSDTDLEYAHSLNLTDAEIREIADDFLVYWTDRTDAGGRKSARGWHQTWRNRCRDVAPQFIRNRRMAGTADSGGYGSGGGIAGIAARRHAGG